jgi:hypothetical protein
VIEGVDDGSDALIKGESALGDHGGVRSGSVSVFAMPGSLIVGIVVVGGRLEDRCRDSLWPLQQGSVEEGECERVRGGGHFHLVGRRGVVPEGGAEDVELAVGVLYTFGRPAIAV